MFEIYGSEPVANKRRVPFILVDSTDGETPETGLTFSGTDIKISKPGSNEQNFAGNYGEIGAGQYYYEPTTTEINTPGYFLFRVSKTGCQVFNGMAMVRPPVPLVYVTIASVTDATKFRGNTELSSTDGFYEGCVLAFITGNLVVEARRVSSYTGATREFSFVKTFTSAPSANDQAILTGRID